MIFFRSILNGKICAPFVMKLSCVVVTMRLPIRGVQKRALLCGGRQLSAFVLTGGETSDYPAASELLDIARYQTAGDARRQGLRRRCAIPSADERYRVDHPIQVQSQAVHRMRLSAIKIATGSSACSIVSNSSAALPRGTTRPQNFISA